MTSDYRIPAPLQNTIDNLSFLARTQEGEKLFFKEKVHILSSDWGARFRRYYYNENFESQKKIIKEIVENGLDSMNLFKDNLHFPRLIQEFKKAKDGLCNLRNTYLMEIRETGELDTIIYMMEQQIEDYEKENKRDYIEEENHNSETSNESDSD
jgi:hypothetical protein